MVANDIVQLCQFYIRLNAQQVIEALIAFGGFWCFVFGQHLGKLRSQCIGIDHLAFCISWVYAHSLDCDFGRSGIEVFKFQFAHITTVHGVCPFASKLLYIEVMGAHTDFFIGVESHSDLAVLNLFVFLQINHGLYDFGNTRLVVCTEQSVSVCHNEVFAHVL